MEARKYFVKHGMRFNLDSMRTKVLNLRDDMRDGTITKVELLGKVYDEDSIDDFIAELEDLMYKAMDRVTGKEYGRIKAISEARDIMRYATCLAAGMDERDAGYCFMS